MAVRRNAVALQSCVGNDFDADEGQQRQHAIVVHVCRPPRDVVARGDIVPQVMAVVWWNPTKEIQQGLLVCRTHRWDVNRLSTRGRVVVGEARDGA